MTKIRLVDQGVIYRNPNPGYEFHFACHSHLVQLTPQELLCTFQRGQALYSLDSVMMQARSTDGGRTWQSEGLIHDSSGDDRAYSYHAPVSCRLPDGSLVMTAQRWDRSDPTHPVFNQQTGGILPADTLLYRSGDKGASWSGPQVLQVPEGMVITPSCSIVVLSNGQWFQAFDQWHAYHDPGPYKPRTVGLFSSDEGRSWLDPVTFGVGSGTGKGHWHGRVIRQRDDSLFALFWTADLKSGKNLTLHASTGTPDGRQWSDPVPTNIPGQTNWAVDLGGGRMAVVYTVRETHPPGFFAACSEDGGLTWDLDNQIQVWDATGRDKIGTDAPESYPRSHDTIAFGAPMAIRLADGDILATFWCTEVSVTQIRFARLKVE